jgi:hypothetical protein
MTTVTASFGFISPTDFANLDAVIAALTTGDNPSSAVRLALSSASSLAAVVVTALFGFGVLVFFIAAPSCS